MSQDEYYGPDRITKEEAEKLKNEVAYPLMKRARSFTEFWDAMIQGPIKVYHESQRDLYRLAFYSGALHLIVVGRGKPPKKRQSIAEEVWTYLHITDTDISMPPTSGPFRDGWTAFADRPLYDTPDDPELRDFYRAAYYNGAGAVLALVTKDVSIHVMTQEIESYLATVAPH